MKKLLSFILVSAMIFSFAACSASQPQPGPAASGEPAASASPEPEASAQPDDSSDYEAQRAELDSLLTDFGTMIQAGSAGSSLKATAQAARLMSWGVSTGMTDEQITAETGSFLSRMSDTEKNEYLMQINSLDSAYQQLLLPGQEELLDSAGCSDSGYPWSDSPIPAVESLMSAMGLRASDGAEAPVQPAADLSAYSDILEKYYSAVTNRLDDASLPQELNHNLQYFYQSGDPGTLGYCLYDVNGDGTQELLIGPSGTADYLETSTYPASWIFDMYTINDGQCVNVFQGWERNVYQLCSGGIIQNQASDSAFNSWHVYYSLSGGSLVSCYAVIYDAQTSPDAPWFLGHQYNYDLSDMQNISEKEALDIINNYDATVIELQYTPLSALH